MTVAFVLSGGGSLGAVQVGMLQALGEFDVAPDLVIGTSVGAINAAWAADRPGPDGARELERIWRGIRRQDIFPMRPLTGLAGFSGRRDHLFPADALRGLLRRHLAYELIEDAKIDLKVVATEAVSGIEVVLGHGKVIDAVMASAAIPGVFPSVAIDGHRLVDGGLSNNTPISRAVEAGATTIYVLPTGYSCALRGAPRGALSAALQSITLLIQQRLAAEVADIQEHVDLRVLPTLCPLGVSPIDFAHTGDLIERSRDASRRWLRLGGTGHETRAALMAHRH
jgi:NTE family protein